MNLSFICYWYGYETREALRMTVPAQPGSCLTSLSGRKMSFSCFQFLHSGKATSQLQHSLSKSVCSNSWSVSNYNQTVSKLIFIINLLIWNSVISVLIRPTVWCVLLVGGKCIGVNPKINNMIIAFEEAQSEFIWLCDSNIIGRTHYNLFCRLVGHSLLTVSFLAGNSPHKLIGWVGHDLGYLEVQL